MKIDGTSISPIGSVNASNRLRQLERKQVELGKDGVAVSDKAQLYQSILKKVKEVSEIREDKVRQVSEQIAKGEFKIDSGKIAEKLIENSME